MRTSTTELVLLQLVQSVLMLILMLLLLLLLLMAMLMPMIMRHNRCRRQLVADVRHRERVHRRIVAHRHQAAAAATQRPQVGQPTAADDATDAVDDVTSGGLRDAIESFSLVHVDGVLASSPSAVRRHRARRRGAADAL
jgi:hypothetical protein